jgi:hypothetical protein
VAKDVRTYTDSELVEQIKDKYPETVGMTATGVVDWALRKLLTEEAMA